jgi:hypothetical protein
MIFKHNVGKTRTRSNRLASISGCKYGKVLEAHTRSDWSVKQRLNVKVRDN